MRKNRYAVLTLTLLVLLFFRSLFFGGHVSWGDAPYYFQDEFNANVAAFFAWSHEGASFGGVNMLVWLEPLVGVVSLISSVLSLDSNTALLAFFYLPAIFLATATSYVFARFLGIKKAYLVSLLYVFNTYFLLLVDGGQLGVMLGYGLFPFTVLALFNLQIKKLGSIAFALLALQALTFAEPRLSLVAIIVSALYLIFTKPVNVLAFVPLGFFMALFNAYWLWPLTKIGTNSINLAVSELQTYSLINGLTLYQPLWPNNQYGVVSYPGVIFWLLACLIWLFLLQKNKYKSSPIPFLLLICIFLLKGTTAPFGNLYQYFLGLPLGSAMRDSSKFFAPVIIFSGILMASFGDKIKNKNYEILTVVVVVISVLPAIGGLRHALSGRSHPQEFFQIAELEAREPEFTKTLWFPGVYPISFESSKHQAINAFELDSIDIFAMNITGTRDLMNFMSSSDSSYLLRSLGINRIVLAKNHRKLALDSEELLEWENLEAAINNNQAFFPLSGRHYKLLNAKPPLYKTHVLHILPDYPESFENLDEGAVAFLSDGKFDTKVLDSAPSGSVVIEGTELDLAMNLLQTKITPLPVSGWAKYRPEERLTWQYQLMIRGMAVKAFDFGVGMSFSENAGEEIEIDKNGDVLALRAAFRDEQSRLVLMDGDRREEISSSSPDKFAWYFFDVPYDSDKVKLVNGGGLVAINGYAWLEASEFENALARADLYKEKFAQPQKDRLYKLNYEQVSPVEYRVPRAPGNWLMFSDKYNPLWQIDNKAHFVALGNFNGYLLDEREIELKFTGQKYLQTGMIITFFGYGVALIAIIYLWTRKPPN